MNIVEKCLQCLGVQTTRVVGCRPGEDYRVEVPRCNYCLHREEQGAAADKWLHKKGK